MENNGPTDEIFTGAHPILATALKSRVVSLDLYEARSRVNWLVN